MKTHGGGHIAVISSIAGVKGLAPAPSYSATKAFQNTYIQALEQLAYSQRLPIRFTDIRPGFVDTALIAGSGFPMKMKPEVVAHRPQHIPSAPCGGYRLALSPFGVLLASCAQLPLAASSAWASLLGCGRGA